MGNLKIFFSNLATILSFVLLQLLTSDILGQNCFVYIGAILFLDWSRNNCLWHMLCAFFIGIFFDVAYHTLGIHTFSLVLIAYVKYYILIFLIPGYSRERYDLSIRNFGLSKVVLYSFVCSLVFYISLFVLALCKDIAFTTGIVKNYLVCVSVLCLCQVVMLIIDLILDAR